MIPTALLVAVATATAITVLRTQGDHARLTQIALADMRAELNQESALEWEARSAGEVSAEIVVKRLKLKARLADLTDYLASASPDQWKADAPSRRLLARYESAIDDKLASIALGHLGRAERIDSGESMLSVAPALVSVAKAVRSSHERVDGNGYPDGLAGDAIPLASRVIFVCDAFHAMTTDRPYGMATSVDDALRELQRCSGTRFDPQVVRAFEASLTAAPSPVLVAV